MNRPLASSARPQPSSLAATPSQRRALAFAVALLFGLAGGTGWLVQRGLARGETFTPTKRASPSRTVRRAAEPAMFWVSVGLCGLVGTGALALGIRGCREAARLSAAHVRP